jgi:2-polyprenyl-6-methoxyphenol hydroxylase-like FAD-dependent oxidoreductase
LPVAQQNAFFAEDLAGWRDRIGAYWPDVRPLFDQLDHAGLSRAVYRDVSTGRWNHGACTLLGDAAHGTSPQLGQGANLALIDAVELAERLAEPKSVAVSLGRFQAERRRHTALYQLLSRALTPLYQSGGGFWSAVRDWVYAPISMWPGVRRLGAQFLVGAVRLGRWPASLKP